MRADDIAPLLAPQGREEMGFRQGRLIAWDPLTGGNQVTVAGSTLDDVPTLAASTIELAPGDVVGLIRVRAQYFIVGRIASAGSGALTNRSATIATQESTTSATYTDLATPGPSVSAYIGSSRQCLVMVQVAINALTPCVASCVVAVSGASSFQNAYPAFLGSDHAQGNIAGSATSTTLMDVTYGLNSGLNTFTLKYARTLTGTGGGDATFQYRTITVIPF